MTRARVARREGQGGSSRERCYRRARTGEEWRGQRVESVYRNHARPRPDASFLMHCMCFRWSRCRPFHGRLQLQLQLHFFGLKIYRAMPN